MWDREEERETSDNWVNQHEGFVVIPIVGSDYEKTGEDVNGSVSGPSIVATGDYTYDGGAFGDLEDNSIAANSTSDFAIVSISAQRTIVCTVTAELLDTGSVDIDIDAGLQIKYADDSLSERFAIPMISYSTSFENQTGDTEQTRSRSVTGGAHVPDKSKLTAGIIKSFICNLDVSVTGSGISQISAGLLCDIDSIYVYRGVL
jgi:hypothetical protein